MKLAIFSIG
jgi:hypothetical protein